METINSADDESFAPKDNDAEISSLSGIKEYTHEELETTLVGLPREIMLSAWGDMWLFDSENDKNIIVYYDNEGNVKYIKFNDTAK